MRGFLMGLVLLAGALNAVQAGCNAALTRVLGPWWGAIGVSLIALVVMAAATLAAGGALPANMRIQAAPWWAWMGGVLGALYVIAMLIAAGPLGSAVFTGLSVTAAILASVLLDHFGWVGFTPHPAGIPRILGAVLMIAGVGLIAAF